MTQFDKPKDEIAQVIKSSSKADIADLVNEIQDLKLDIHELDKSITRLANVQNREFQWKYIVPVSLLRGLGTAIGATIMFAVLLYILGLVIAQLESVPILEQIVDSIPWDQIIEKALSN